MDAERWAPVPGSPGYQVSDQGRVKTEDRMVTGRDGRAELHRGKVLKPQRMKNGYREVYVCIDSHRKHRTIHSLVAQAFLGEKPKGYDVMHLNGDRSDNRLENLAYGTRAENFHSTYNYGGKQANGKLSLDDVDEVRRRIDRGESCVDVAKDFNVDSAAIYHIKNGTTFAWYEGSETVARKA